MDVVRQARAKYQPPELDYFENGSRMCLYRVGATVSIRSHMLEVIERQVQVRKHKQTAVLLRIVTE